MTIVLCIDGIPQRGLNTGQTYEVLDSYNCDCGSTAHRLLSVNGAYGRALPAVWHKRPTPIARMGWFLAKRFIPLTGDRQLTTEERRVPQLETTHDNAGK